MQTSIKQSNYSSLGGIQDGQDISVNRISTWGFSLSTSWAEHPVTSVRATAWIHLAYCLSTLSLGTNLSEWLNIQKRDKPSSGPSFRNSWPSPLPHLPHRTLKAVNVSMCFVTLSSRMVSVKAGQGEECSYLDLLKKSGCPHWEHTYMPGLKWSL